MAAEMPVRLTAGHLTETLRRLGDMPGLAARPVRAQARSAATRRAAKHGAFHRGAALALEARAADSAVAVAGSVAAAVAVAADAAVVVADTAN